nr:MAG TPA: hypothetical protein [Caudoviricetes sp.]
MQLFYFFHLFLSFLSLLLSQNIKIYYFLLLCDYINTIEYISQ